MVHISNPTTIVNIIDEAYSDFCTSNNITNQYKVGSFIFPQRAYEILGFDREKLYANRERIHNVIKGRWGSYFNQIANWKETNGRYINQIEEIINLINAREPVYKSAYTLQIANPIKHLKYTIGGPCLRYITLQLEPNPQKINLLALYRNHDFAEKAYGNYIGLGNLLHFLATQTNFELGTVACVSSHAYIDSKYRRDLRYIVEEVSND